MIDFLKVLIAYFDSHNIPYMLSGSVAMSLHTVPRFTRDFDFIVHLKNKDIKGLTAHFKGGYYCDEDAIKEAIVHSGMFNIIDHKSNYKADFIILKNEPYRLAEFERRILVDFFEMKVSIVSPEDLLISKIIWAQQSHSALQLEDIRLLSLIKGLDWPYIKEWSGKLKLNTFELF